MVESKNPIKTQVLNENSSLPIQVRLSKDTLLRKPYSFGPYNKANSKEQWIRISEGCPNNCPYCYEPTEQKWFGVPQIVRNHVKIMDMNLLCKSQAYDTIVNLKYQTVKNHVVYYELICGIDYRFLTQEIADSLHESRFQRIRLAWDGSYSDQKKIKDAIQKLVKAKYKPEELMVFMLCNWRIPYTDNLNKLDLCKVWNVKVCDCYFDGQVSPHIVPVHWAAEQIYDFRRRTRRHNQLVNFKCDPLLEVS